MTVAECVLWNELRNSQLGYKFRRQHVIGDFIVDFVCLSRRLVIELDGGYHDQQSQVRYDQSRTESLQQMGFRVIRFKNEQVCNQTSEVLNQIKQQLL